MGDLERILTRIPHLETLHTSFISHPLQPHNCIFFLSFHRLFIFSSSYSLSLSLPPYKVHLRWTETVTKTKTLTDDIQPFLEAREKEKGIWKSGRTVSRIKSFRVPPSMNSVIRLSRLSLYKTPMNFKTCGWSRLLITFTWKRERESEGKNTNC